MSTVLLPITSDFTEYATRHTHTRDALRTTATDASSSNTQFAMNGSTMHRIAVASLAQGTLRLLHSRRPF